MVRRFPTNGRRACAISVRSDVLNVRTALIIVLTKLMRNSDYLNVWLNHRLSASVVAIGV